MGKYDKHNERVSEGNGVCGTCGGKTHTTGYCHCYLCDKTPSGRGKCNRCNGTGVDKFGAHCTNCKNNKKWDTYEYSKQLYKESRGDR